MMKMMLGLAVPVLGLSGGLSKETVINHADKIIKHLMALSVKPE
jgi:hypothetical protein